MDDAKRIPGVKQVSIVHGIGETVTDIHSSTDRIGFVITQAESESKAVAIAETAMKCISVLG